jgi:hypothetical protein
MISEALEAVPHPARLLACRDPSMAFCNAPLGGLIRHGRALLIGNRPYPAVL